MLRHQKTSQMISRSCCSIVHHLKPLVNTSFGYCLGVKKTRQIVLHSSYICIIFMLKFAKKVRFLSTGDC